MIIIKNIEIYAPEKLGKKDILIGGNKILDINTNITYPHAEIYDGSNMIGIPGLIDQHIHIIGGGGEGGFATKACEANFDDLIDGGVTTVLGLLGTDGYSRSIENLISKAKGLKEEGMNALCVTGSYAYPSITLSGSIAKDIMFIDEIIGCKIALSDHRSSHLTLAEFIRLASEIRTAAMLANKAGIMVIHMGDESSGMELIEKALEQTDIPITLFRPTHVNRNPSLLAQAIRFNKQGGWIDLTCQDEPIALTYLKLKNNGCQMDHVTLSSDGQGSWSKYDDEGNCIAFGISSVKALHQELCTMVQKYEIDLAEALCCMTINPANALKLRNKGQIAINKDADLVLLEQHLQIKKVMINGQWYK